MTVSTFTQPDRTSQSGSAYPANIDASINVLAKTAGMFAPRQTTTPAMTVTLDAGRLFVAGAVTEVASQATGTITAPTTNPRIDRVVIDTQTGVVSVVTGSEAASPTAPAITSGKLPIAQVLLQTSSTTITNSMITDERIPGIDIGGLDIIASGSLSGNNVSVTDIPQTYSSLIVHCIGASVGGVSTDVVLLMSTDNGSSYDSTAANYSGYSVDELGAVAISANANALLVPTKVISSAETVDFTTAISGYQAGPYAQLQSRVKDTDAAPKTHWTQGAYLSTSGINALQIDCAAGAAQFDAGTYAVYGVR